MPQNAPGQSHRQGISLVQAVEMFSDEETVERMFIDARWPDGVACVECGSLNIQERPTRKPQPFRCRDCRKDFSIKTGTVMQGSNLPLSKWALAAYIMTTSLRGVSSMKLHRDLNIGQKAAWHLAHRIRKAWESDDPLFSGPVEVDETYVGGLERNRHASERRHRGRGPVNMTPVAGVVDRDTGQVSSAPVENTRRETLEEFIYDRVEPDAMVYTDDHGSYRSLPNHEVVRHSEDEYVRGDVHTNTIESHWGLLKRSIMGTYYHLSPKHLHRYTTELDGRRNNRPLDTVDQVQGIMRGMVGKRLRYIDLIGPEHTRINGRRDAA